MKTASVRSTRRLRDGHRLILIACPSCDGRHWIADADRGECPRTAETFTVNPQPRRSTT